jgi:hypothetical protein
MIPDIKTLILYIARYAYSIKNKLFSDIKGSIDYVALFSQDYETYQKLDAEVSKLGKIVEATETGKTYLLFDPLPLGDNNDMARFIKVRLPETGKDQIGDVDFRLDDYELAKPFLLSLPGTQLIKRNYYEMIELRDHNYNILVYFSHPSLSESLGFNKLSEDIE